MVQLLEGNARVVGAPFFRILAAREAVQWLPYLV